MNISLTQELDRWISEKVKSGLYKSSSEVVRDGLRALQRQEEGRRAMIEDLRQELLVGIKQLDSGKSGPFDTTLIEEVKKNGRRKLGV